MFDSFTDREFENERLIAYSTKREIRVPGTSFLTFGGCFIGNCEGLEKEFGESRR